MSIKLYVIDMVVLAIALLNFRIFRVLEVDSVLFTISKVVLVTGCILYMIMHFYLYQIIITFEVTLWHAFKNSLLFTLAKLPMNLLVLVMVFVAGWILILYPLLFVIIGITPFAFATNFYAARVIKKLIILKTIIE